MDLAAKANATGGVEYDRARTVFVGNLPHDTDVREMGMTPSRMATLGCFDRLRALPCLPMWLLHVGPGVPLLPKGRAGAPRV